MSQPSSGGLSGAVAHQDPRELYNRAFEYDKAQNYAEAARLYRQAAEQGFPPAQNALGILYRRGQGVPQDDVEAAKWYRQAAEQRFPRAQFNLGFSYAKGKGVPQDYAEAAKWYRRAADLGDSRAQNNLGDLYENGKGVPQDYTEAIKWYRQAANGGEGVACRNLGNMHQKGLGVPRDPVQAYIWFNLAATTLSGPNRDEAIKERDALAAQMTPSQRAATQKPPEEAQKHYKVALVALKNNDLSVATDELQKAAKGAPGNALILYSLATVQAKQGNTEQAKKNLELAKQLGLPPEEREAVEGLEATISYQRQKQRTIPKPSGGECPKVRCVCDDRGPGDFIFELADRHECLINCDDICEKNKEQEMDLASRRGQMDGCPKYTCRCKNWEISGFAVWTGAAGCLGRDEACREGCKSYGGVAE